MEIPVKQNEKQEQCREGFRMTAGELKEEQSRLTRNIDAWLERDNPVLVNKAELEACKSSLLRMDYYTERLLDLFRYSHGLLETVPCGIEMKGHLHYLVSKIQAKTAEMGASFTFQQQEGDAYLQTDLELLNKVLLQIFTKACYSAKGCGSVVVSAVQQKQGCKVCVDLTTVDRFSALTGRELAEQLIGYKHSPDSRAAAEEFALQEEMKAIRCTLREEKREDGCRWELHFQDMDGTGESFRSGTAGEAYLWAATDAAVQKQLSLLR